MRKGVLGIGIFLIISGITITSLSLISVPFTTTKSFQVSKSSTEINESLVVQAGTHQYYTKSFPSGTELWINFIVTSGGNRDVNFWITDEVQYYKWKARESSTSYIYRDRASSFDERWISPTDKTLYFVFDNSFSVFTSKSLSFRVDRFRIETEQRQVTENRTLLQSEASYLGIAILFIGTAVAGFGIISKSKNLR